MDKSLKSFNITFHRCCKKIEMDKTDFIHDANKFYFKTQRCMDRHMFRLTDEKAND
jgi:hypothetical protein